VYANLSLLVLSLVVAGAMAWILVWFFRRLRAIEAARWGADVHKRGLSQEMEWTSALRRLAQATGRLRKPKPKPQTP
jgi:Zn-dependent protease with chaperone function